MKQFQLFFEDGREESLEADAWERGLGTVRFLVPGCDPMELPASGIIMITEATGNEPSPGQEREAVAAAGQGLAR